MLNWLLCLHSGLFVDVLLSARLLIGVAGYLLCPGVVNAPLELQNIPCGAFYLSACSVAVPYQSDVEVCWTATRGRIA